jgi:DNA-binding SARP family transcriptional activator/tetratricopeptide (TPR) repeat protein
MDNSGAEGRPAVTPRWSVRLFGGFKLTTIEGAAITLPGKRERIVLAYLLMSPDCRQPRRKLAGFLWADATEEAALHNLRTCIYGVRNALGDPERRLLVADGEDISLEPATFEVDAWAFRDLARRDGSQSLEKATALYTGSFLDGLDIDSEHYESWQRTEATLFRDQVVDILMRLVAGFRDAGEMNRVLQLGQRLLNIDPMHEGAVRALMQVYAKTGRRGAAVQLYQSLARVLRAELDVEPEPETRRVFAELTQSPLETATPREPEAARRADPSLAMGIQQLPIRAGDRARSLASRRTIAISATALIGLMALSTYASISFVSSAGDSKAPTASAGVEAPASNSEIDPAAYNQYLRAKALVRGRSARRGIQPLANAATLLEQVSAKYPQYAPAWALAARVHELTPAVQLAGNAADTRLDTTVAFEKAEVAARRAIELEPDNADAYLALGTVQQRRGKLAEAEELLARALKADPNNADVLDQYAGLLAEVGRVGDALSVQQQLKALESFVPIYNVTNARFLWLNGQNEAAIAEFKALPNGREANVARVYASLGRYSEAADLLRQAAATPNAPSWMWAAARLLRVAPEQSSFEDLPSLGLTESYIYAFVGSPERVLEPYEKIAETGYASNVFISYVGILWHPAYASVRHTDRFKAFARKIGLVEYWNAKGWPASCRPSSAGDFTCS